MPKVLERAVPDITCGQCQDAVEGAVTALPGVTVADVSTRTRAVAVLYDAPAEPAGIEAAIRGAGYRICPHATQGRTT
ncbi:heavy-metal-associated domain-containing protein [Streptomyces sp. NBC_01236]|uniref:heavy-metal-associated domain-containing protein n=1 Tax=Streptomyces sp. NBC_01236 TaxID=2903789 RepID=UPI002E11C82A|nr:heavy-metal-associated domain-containing protein [Streptomyces sp. NBC_01236]